MCILTRIGTCNCANSPALTKWDCYLIEHVPLRSCVISRWLKNVFHLLLPFPTSLFSPSLPPCIAADLRSPISSPFTPPLPSHLHSPASLSIDLPSSLGNRRSTLGLEGVHDLEAVGKSQVSSALRNACLRS